MVQTDGNVIFSFALCWRRSLPSELKSITEKARCSLPRGRSGQKMCVSYLLSVPAHGALISAQLNLPVVMYVFESHMCAWRQIPGDELPLREQTKEHAQATDRSAAGWKGSTRHWQVRIWSMCPAPARRWRNAARCARARDSSIDEFTLWRYTARTRIRSLCGAGGGIARMQRARVSQGSMTRSAGRALARHAAGERAASFLYQ